MRNTGKLIKGPGVVASVARFGWWTASDVPKELALQLWLKISEKYQKPDLRPRCRGGVGGFLIKPTPVFDFVFDFDFNWGVATIKQATVGGPSPARSRTSFFRSGCVIHKCFRSTFLVCKVHSFNMIYVVEGPTTFQTPGDISSR